MPNAQVELDGIERVFRLGDSEVHALRDLSFTIDAGEYVAVIELDATTHHRVGPIDPNWPKWALRPILGSSPSNSRESAMTAAVPHASETGLAQLQRKPVSDVKREGWRGVMKSVGAAGKVLMTNHDRPEAVILSPQEFQRLTDLAESALRDKQRALEKLGQAFDAELAVLKQADAGPRLRQAFGAPLALKGKVIAGRGD